MNSSEAKAPKFEGTWWRSKKARNSDADGSVEKALKKYEAERKGFLALANSGGKASLRDIKASLEAVHSAVVKAQRDPKLGSSQKETKDGLATYEKRSDVAIKECERVERSPIMKMKAVELVRHAPQFESYCKRRLASENYDFLSLMLRKSTLDRRTYDTFIKNGAPAQVNISSSGRSGFDVIAAAIDAGTSPDSVATWAKAPWADAAKEVAAMTDGDVVPGFRMYLAGQELKTKLP